MLAALVIGCGEDDPSGTGGAGGGGGLGGAAAGGGGEAASGGGGAAGGGEGGAAGGSGGGGAGGQGGGGTDCIDSLFGDIPDGGSVCPRPFVDEVIHCIGGLLAAQECAPGQWCEEVGELQAACACNDLPDRFCPSIADCPTDPDCN